MKTPQTGIITRFLEVSSVRTPTRRELSEGTQDQYTYELRKFWRWSGKKPASQWTGADVEGYLHHLRDQRYSRSSRSSRKTALCALVYVFKHVLQRELGTLNLPAMPKEKPALKIIPNRQEIGRIFGPSCSCQPASAPRSAVAGRWSCSWLLGVPPGRLGCQRRELHPHSPPF